MLGGYIEPVGDNQHSWGASPAVGSRWRHSSDSVPLDFSPFLQGRRPRAQFFAGDGSWLVVLPFGEPTKSNGKWP